MLEAPRKRARDEDDDNDSAEQQRQRRNPHDIALDNNDNDNDNVNTDSSDDEDTMESDAMRNACFAPTYEQSNDPAPTKHAPLETPHQDDAAGQADEGAMASRQQHARPIILGAQTRLALNQLNPPPPPPPPPPLETSNKSDDQDESSEGSGENSTDDESDSDEELAIARAQLAEQRAAEAQQEQHQEAVDENSDAPEAEVKSDLDPEPSELVPETQTLVERASPPLNIPSWMLPPNDVVALPTQLKELEIIEKTARAVAVQGTQLEIVIKTKQRSNPLFGFLLFDHPLNPFYKHLLQLIKGPSSEANALQKGPQQVPGPVATPVLPAASVSASSTGASGVPHFMQAARLPVVALAPQVKPLSAPALIPTTLQSAAVPAPVQPVPLSVSAPPLPPSMDDTPPPHILEIVRKTVPFVARNGIEFEATLSSRNANDARFDFLNPWNPYHGYYRRALEQEMRHA